MDGGAEEEESEAFASSEGMQEPYIVSSFCSCLGLRNTVSMSFTCCPERKDWIGFIGLAQLKLSPAIENFPDEGRFNGSGIGKSGNIEAMDPD